MTFTTIHGNRLFHTDEGPADGGQGTLLLVHGEACDSHDWSAQLGAFASRYRVIVPDLRGHGRSTGLSGGMRPRDFVADLVELLHLLDTGPVTVVGHSLGAVVASVLAVEHPELVRAVVAVEPAYGFTPRYASPLAAAFRVPDPVEVAAAFVAGLEGSDSGPGPDALRVWHRRRVLGMDAMTVRDVFHGLFDEAAVALTVRPGVESYLARRSCPVLSLSAGASLKAKGIDGGWEESLSLHPCSVSVVLDGVGHWMHQERPSEINALVLGWLDGLPALRPKRKSDTRG